mgnify:CR=1 FL=1
MSSERGKGDIRIMSIEGWKYYNHAAIPTTAPHEEVNLNPINNKSIWNMKGVLLARWTSDFDCKEETNWWYVIKDTPFDISKLKAKRRYEINKGNKNFEVCKINPLEHKEELYKVTVEAYKSWPERYRPNVQYEAFVKSIKNWVGGVVYGAYHREESKLCGYAILTSHKDYIDFNVLRVIPEYEKYAINAAVICHILSDNTDFLTTGGYICDGSRSIRHETAFQDYLEKYFGFRKAYCHLHITYKPFVSLTIKILYPFRKLLGKFDTIGIVHSVIALLKMEEVMRN